MNKAAAAERIANEHAVSRFYSLLADESPPGKEHPLWAWLDSVPAVDPEGAGWLTISPWCNPTVVSQFLERKASALACIASLAAVVPPRLEHSDDGPLCLEECLRDLAQVPAPEIGSDVLRSERPIAHAMRRLARFTMYVPRLYGLCLAPEIYCGHPFYLIATHGRLNAFLTAAEYSAPLSAVTVSFALIQRLVDDTDHASEPDSRVDNWLLERCDLGFAGAAIVCAVGACHHLWDPEVFDDVSWLAGHWSLTPEVARRILDDLARPTYCSTFEEGRYSAWALPTLEAKARLDSRLV